AEARGLRGDHRQGAQQQPEDEQQDAEIAGAVCHEKRFGSYFAGVNTRSIPPSSSYAGNRSAVARAGRSPSALTSTGLLRARTPHSRTVFTGSSPLDQRKPSTSRTGRPMTRSSSSPVSANEPRPQRSTRPSASQTKNAA